MIASLGGPERFEGRLVIFWNQTVNKNLKRIVTEEVEL